MMWLLSGCTTGHSDCSVAAHTGEGASPVAWQLERDSSTLLPSVWLFSKWQSSMVSAALHNREQRSLGNL